MFIKGNEYGSVYQDQKQDQHSFPAIGGLHWQCWIRLGFEIVRPEPACMFGLLCKRHASLFLLRKIPSSRIMSRLNQLVGG